MARQLFIRLEDVKETGRVAASDSDTPAPSCRASWLVLENGRPLGKLMRGDLSSAVPLAASAQVIAAVPAEHVLLLDVALPGRNRQKLLNAVPYAVEDYLIDEVESLHFALSPYAVNDQYTVAVIDREHLIAWQKLLDDAGLHPQVMLPDCLALKYKQQEWSVLDSGERLFVRTGPFQGFITNRESVQQLLTTMLAETEMKPRLIEIRTPAGDQYDWPESIDEIPIVRKEYEAEASVLLACDYAADASINLLQGEFSRRENISRHLRPWYGTAALLAVWLVWQGGLNAFEYFQLKGQHSKLQKQIEQVYKRTFPGSTRVVNASLQMKQKLAELRRQSGKGGSTMAEMLSFAAPVLMTASELKLNNLRFQDGKLDLELEVKDLQTLDKLKEKLAQRQDWKVDIQSASTNKDRVESRIQIRGTGS